ncbi:MAG: hypothetical protein O3B64_00260 [bacterium]|nr:hypothetical protein [bacterium]MDA1024553.1 hypothetical protein [bacterium]
MTKTNRWWDILVLWPFIYGALVTIMAILIAVNSSEADVITLFTGIAASLMLLSYFVTAILFFVTFVYAIHRLYTATTLDNEHKKSWLIVILIFNVFAIPFLHFMHLKK